MQARSENASESSEMGTIEIESGHKSIQEEGHRSR
jgi:hypothetical protein